MNTGAAPTTWEATYARVSSEEQVENTSLDHQEQACAAAALIKNNDHTVPRLYREEGWSGTNADRPQWQRLLADCRAGRVTRMYALNWSRLARDSVVGTQIKQEMAHLGVDLVIVETDFDSNSIMGDFLHKLMILLAEMDRNSLVERMARGQHAMAGRGLWPSGSASPFGYRATGGKTNTLVIHDEEAATIRLMVDWIVDERLTTGEVSRRLNAMGRFTRTGKEWCHSNLRRILRQRVLVGEVIWGNTEKTHRSYVPSGKYGPPVLLKFGEVISESRFAALQVALDVRATDPKAGRQPYALSGRLVSPCEVNYGGVYRADRGLRQYRCRTRQWTAKTTPRCKHPLLMADQVEDRVWTAVTALLSDHTRLLALAQDYLGLRVHQVGVEKDELAELRTNIPRLEKQQRTTLVDLVRRGLDADAVEEATKVIAADLLAARTRLAEVEAWAADSGSESAKVRGIWELAELAQDRLERMSPAQRARVFALLDVRVIVLDDTKRPALRIEGTVCHEKLLDSLSTVGDLSVAGSHGAAPRHGRRARRSRTPPRSSACRPP